MNILMEVFFYAFTLIILGNIVNDVYFLRFPERVSYANWLINELNFNNLIEFYLLRNIAPFNLFAGGVLVPIYSLRTVESIFS